jgi:FkbM family methyltransferase
MKIQYGVNTILIDITDICYTRLKRNNMIIIPDSDLIRASYFTDPAIGILKSVFITINNYTIQFEDTKSIYIDLLTNLISTEMPHCIKMKNDIINHKLLDLHSRLQLKYGTFQEEFPEQKMAVSYLSGNEKVLEIGGNIGRNSLIIASLLTNQSNFVVLECDKHIASQLKENRDSNQQTFFIENSALSKRTLIQRGWDTIASDILLPGYQPVETITYDELNSKYNIQFDTLVLDCEGAFYYILMDMPEILNHVNLIIMENDYHTIEPKQYVDRILIENGFYVDYSEVGGWGPCFSRFFEVWKRS